MRFATLGLITLAARTFAASKIAQSCKGSKDNTNAYVCFSMNIPDASTTGSTGVVYLQISGNAGFSWMGLGTGDSMAGSTILIIYADSLGNVTLSTRSSSGHFQPVLSTDPRATLLDGSGQTPENLTANIKCENWSTSRSNWIWGALYGGFIVHPTSHDATLQQHDQDVGSISFDLVAASGGDDSNPFIGQVSLSATGDPSSTRTNTPTNTANTPDPSSTYTPGSNGSKKLLRGEIAGIVVAIVLFLLFCIGLCFVLRKRKQKARGKPTEDSRETWEKPEIDGRAVPFVELPGEMDAIEVPTKPMAPVELPADMSHGTRRVEEQI